MPASQRVPVRTINAFQGASLILQGITGYVLNGVQEASNGLSAQLSFNGKLFNGKLCNEFGHDVQDLILEVKYETATRYV
jgi:hypothetical protein